MSQRTSYRGRWKVNIYPPGRVSITLGVRSDGADEQRRIYGSSVSVPPFPLSLLLSLALPLGSPYYSLCAGRIHQYCNRPPSKPIHRHPPPSLLSRDSDPSLSLDMVSAHILALALVPWVITFIPKVSAAYSYSSHPALIRRQVAAPSQLFPVKRSADPSVFKVVVESVPYFRAAPLCLQKGMALADVTTTNWKELVQVEEVGVKAWISSWNQ